MKNQVNEFREPRIRVSRKVYIKVMETVLNEAVFLDPEMARMLIYAVRAYLQSARNAPTSGDKVYKLFRRYRDIIDQAAGRSARARAAAQRRREAREAASLEIRDFGGTEGDGARDGGCSEEVAEASVAAEHGGAVAVVLQGFEVVEHRT